MSAARTAWARVLGVAVVVALVVLAFGLPQWTDWDVHSRAPRSEVPHATPPLHGWWQPRWLGPGTLPAVAVGLAGWRWGALAAGRLRWRRLLLSAYLLGLGWLLSLALVDGVDGLSRQLGGPYAYLPTARAVTDVPGLLEGYVDRIPLHSAGAWPTDVAGHPPGLLLFFVGLVRLGLGSDLAAGLAVTAIAASVPVAVLVTLRALHREELARRATCLLVLGPAAVFLAVSADAVIAAVCAWGVACLALAARSSTARRSARWSARWSARGTARGTVRGTGWWWAVLAGLLFGTAVMMSYGMVLFALVALAVVVVTRRGQLVPVVAAVEALVVLAFAAAGFAWWAAFPVLRERYWDGIAANRPGSYWWWADLAALVVCVGPLVGAGLGQLLVRWRSSDPVVRGLVAGAVLAVAVADASLMSKAEVERIWLPFVPWLLLSAALLPAAWRRWGLLAQLVVAVLVEQLLYTTW